ncbi:Nop14-like protein, putative [Bodo saltans]|uniref:Nop14-like protein, putative n=1 Tax=Bodo saltans TaxID=75058 RepID=A0A0S4JFE1_BODSA|nr:Nop14-like protein, putative [Bodo saltans]|eukprot:CUG88887.1 Nop14-like protein, putative [Bodo saltans]
MSTKSQLNKSVQYYKTKQESQHAQQSANRFTQKQSQFARREEERQVNETQASSGSVISRFEAGRRQDVRGRTHVPSTSTAAPSYASGNKLMQSGNRRTQKYQLDNVPQDQSSQDRRRPREEVTSFGSLLGASSSSAADRDDGSNSDGDGEGPRKKTRFEKFQEVMTKSKMHRIEQQKERTNRDQETNLLDEEFDGVMHLLHKRDRIQEEREAFLASGNAEMREIMKTFKENRKAKVLRLDGASDSLGVEGLDASDRAVFAKLTKGQLTNPTPVDASTPVEHSVTYDDEEDDFDAIMGSMRMETRKAHAVDRTLTEEEEFEHDQRMQQLQADRGEVPTIGTDSELWTRKEWIQRGGDDVFHMGDEDNVDLEYDEEDEDDDVEELEEGDDADEADDASEDIDLAEDEVAPAAVGPQISSSIANPVDRSLANLEAFSRDASKLSTEKRAIGYQALISDIHAASRRHATSVVGRSTPGDERTSVDSIFAISSLHNSVRVPSHGYGGAPPLRDVV